MKYPEQQFTVRLNEQQIEYLVDALSSNPDDITPDRVDITIAFVEGRAHFMLDGSYMHSDGEFAAWPEGQDSDVWCDETAAVVAPDGD